MERILIDHIQIFKALSDKNRLAILDLLINKEQCACEISEELSLAQSKLAYHMKLLCKCGLVQYKNAGKYTYYSVSSKTKEQLFEFLRLLEGDMDGSHEVKFCKEGTGGLR